MKKESIFFEKNVVGPVHQDDRNETIIHGADTLIPTAGFIGEGRRCTCQYQERGADHSLNRLLHTSDPPLRHQRVNRLIRI